MSAADLLAQLDRLGIRLSADEDRLRVGGSRELLTADLIGRIKLDKPDLLRLLHARNGHAPEDPGRYAPFPLTDIQQAYFVGRGEGHPLGGVSCHTYHEFAAGHLDADRLEAAWRKVVDRHDMLRAVVNRDASQRVLREVAPYGIVRHDLRGLPPGAATPRLEEIRTGLAQQVRPADEWPLFDVRFTQLDGGRNVLHFGFDLLIGDAASILLLFDEWRQLYEDPGARLEKLDYTFRQYCVDGQAARSPEFEKAREYWMQRLDTLPPGPELPLARTPASDVRPVFTRRAGRLEAGVWSALKERARALGVTPSVLLSMAYADVLGTWSSRRDFTLNLTIFGRRPVHAQIDRIAGDFTSTLLLEVQRGAATFRERAAALQLRLAADLEHIEFNGVRVLREMARRGEAPLAYGTCVFTSLLGHATPGGRALGWLGEMLYSVSQTPQVFLDHQAREEDGALIYTWDSPEQLFHEGVIDDLFGAYQSLLERLAADGALWGASDLQLVPQAQVSRREDANATAAPLDERRLEILFAEQAARSPQAIAVISPHRSLSYGELRDRAAGLALRLRSCAQPGDRIAVVMEKGWEQVVAVLGILQSGAAYLPIDAGAPEERMRHILQAAGVALAVTQPWLADRVGRAAGIRVLTVTSETERPGAADFPATGGPDDLAYVIYTSGSTGVPKGVMISHRGAVNTILDVNRRFAIGPGDCVLGLSALTFDLSVYDIFGTLAAGGTLVLPDEIRGHDPAHWAELAVRHRVTVWNSVPVLFSLLADYLEPGARRLEIPLRIVLLSGDWIPLNLPDRIRRLAGRASVVSLGGATEASIWSILYPVDGVAPEWKSIPYGRPMANQQFHVLNARLEPCPEWVRGDLYIGGAGVAVGYLGDSGRTAASFFGHPVTGERLYRTGDLGRRLPDGNIEFLGRQDTQVKINGYRIELGEIEAALLQFPGVTAAAASATGDADSRRLAAHIVTAPGTVVADQEIPLFLRRKLPEYMIPGSITRVASMPLGANGKLDRKALTLRDAPTPEPAKAGVALERVLGLIAQILGTPIAPDANLIFSGASSVDLIRLATLAETEFGFRPEMTEFVKMQTAARIAAWYEQHLAAGARAASSGEPAWHATPLILNAKERDDFKQAAHGLRAERPEWRRVALPAPDLTARPGERRTHRRFSDRPVSLANFGSLLSVLRSRCEDGRRSYLYGSAGGSYSVQAHVYVKPDGVEGLGAGTFYYHPERHDLVCLNSGARLTGDLHIFENRQTFEQSMFSIFLICKAGAIAPLYGGKARDFALIEAGLQTQLLEMSAPACEIGLCQIGSLDFEAIRDAFQLEEDHVLLHSLVGGGIGWEEGSL